MTALAIAVNLVAMLALPIVVVGTIDRVKARWAGRRGRPILQLARDLARLWRKTPVYAEVTTPIVRLGPIVVVATAIGSALIVPLAGPDPVIAFPFDFVWFAYAWGLGRVALMLGALDTGSAFEGMGAAREATFAALLEPAVFLVAGALCLQSGERSLAAALIPHLGDGPAIALWVAAIAALAIVVQVESARVPVDDPNTHLELTMIHEVMILDHAGRDLALLQYGAALKLTTGLAILATLLDPFAGQGLAAIPAHLALVLGLAIGLGLVESLIARLRMSAIPQYVTVGVIAAAIALLTRIGHVQ